MRRSLSHRRRLAQVLASAIGLAGAFAVVMGCSTSRDVDGLWRAQLVPHGSDNALIFGPEGAAVGLELVVGQYGPDLSGLVRYYASPEFERARVAEAPDNQCECGWLHQGRIDPVTNKVSFTLKGCVPGSSPDAVLRLRGQFELGTDERLAGTLRVDDPTSPLNDTALQITFDRIGGPGETDASELACRQPTDAANGNVFSGR
jgi:hypothetical protein